MNLHHDMFALLSLHLTQHLYRLKDLAQIVLVQMLRQVQTQIYVSVGNYIIKSKIIKWCKQKICQDQSYEGA